MHKARNPHKFQEIFISSGIFIQNLFYVHKLGIIMCMCVYVEGAKKYALLLVSLAPTTATYAAHAHAS